MNLALALSSPSIYPDQDAEYLSRSPVHGFAGNSISPSGYIRAVKKDLEKKGESYSSSDLQAIGNWLKKAYAACKADKPKKDPSLLSDYRSSLATIGRLQALVQMVEGKTIDDVLGEKGTDTYQKLTLGRIWLSHQNYRQLYAKDGLLVERAYRKVHALVEEKAQNGESLTAGEQKAYTRLVNELDQLESAILKSKIVPFPKPQTKKSPEKSKYVPATPGPKKSLFNRVGSYVNNKMFQLAVLIGVGAAILTGPKEVRQIPTIPAVSVAYASPKYESQKSSPFWVPPSKSSSKSSLEALVSKPKKVLPPGAYEVKKGDILWNLANKTCGDPYLWKTLAKNHGVKDPRKLEVGKVLYLDKLCPKTRKAL